MKLNLKLAKQIGDKLGVDWDKISTSKWKDAMDVELEHSDILSNPQNPTKEDLYTVGKIAFAHLKESYKYYDKLKKMEKNMNENVSLTKDFAKKIGDKLGINWKNNSLDDFYKYMKHEESEFKYMDKELSMDDYLKLGKVAKAHMNENKIRALIAHVLYETMENGDFYNKLKYEMSKKDTHYEMAYNQTLGEYSVDSPDQLSEDDKKNFYDSLDKKLKSKSDLKESRLISISQLMSENRMTKSKLFKEHGVFLTFEDLAMMEVAPPGREDQVKALKKEFPNDKSAPYKIAWSQASKSKNESEKTVLMPPDFETEKKVVEDEDVIQPDTKGKKLITDKGKEKENEVAFSVGVPTDRMDQGQKNQLFITPGQSSDFPDTKVGI